MNSPEKFTKRQKKRAAFGAISIAFYSWTIPAVYMNSLLTDEGRGGDIEFCNDGYKPLIRVDDALSLGNLATLAVDNEVRDMTGDGGTSSTKDIANLAGELGCSVIGESGFLDVVYLTSAGNEAVQYSQHYDPFSGKLPDGFSWVSNTNG